MAVPFSTVLSPGPLLDSLPASVARFDSQLRITVANARLAKILGKSPAELIGCTCSQLGMTREVWGDWEPALRSVFQSGKSGRFEYLAGDRFIQVWIEPELDADGQVAAVVALAITNNKVKDLRVALQTQTDLFAAFMDNGPMIAWMRNAEGRYVYANLPYLHRFNLKSEELYGKTLDERWPKELADQFRANDEKVLATGQPMQVFEPAIEPNGERRTWLNVKFPFHSAQGGTYIGGIGIDMTDRLRIEDERRILAQHLQRTQQLENLSLLANGVANDFNNFLTAVFGSVSLARISPEQAGTYLDRIETAALRAAERCRDLRRYCGHGDLKPRQLDLNTWLQDVRPIMDSLIPGRLGLDLQLAPRPTWIHADPEQLQHVIVNLLTSLTESVPPQGGTITIRTQSTTTTADSLQAMGFEEELAPGLYSLLEITDNGLNSQSSTSLTAHPQMTTHGGGLGLSAVRGIVRAHHGSIAKEQHPQLGMIYRILLPAHWRHSAPSPATATSDPGQMILIVDDEEDVRTVSRRTLEQAGYCVLEAVDGADGLQQFQAHQAEIACVLLDLTMPRMAGHVAFRELRKLRPELKVILTSGFATEEATSAFAPNELAGFLRKPFFPDDLLKSVSVALSHRGTESNSASAR